jgi:hypothetical protein
MRRTIELIGGPRDGEIVALSLEISRALGERALLRFRTVPYQGEPTPWDEYLRTSEDEARFLGRRD